MRSTVAFNAIYVASGMLLILGSIAPWTRGTIGYATPFPFIVDRNGMELGANDGFSVAGLITVALGSLALLDGALGLASRQRPRTFRAVPLVAGLGGVAIGLYGFGEAAWYVRQLTNGYPTVFGAGMSYGIVLVLLGGTALITSVAFDELPGTMLRRAVGALAILLVIATVGAALAPHWSP